MRGLFPSVATPCAIRDAIIIADDELVEITPKSIRLRKRFLKAHERKRAGREESAE